MTNKLEVSYIVGMLLAVSTVTIIYFLFLPPQAQESRQITIQTEIVTTMRDTILSENAHLSTIIYEGHKFVMLKNGSKVDLYLINKEK